MTRELNTDQIDQLDPSTQHLLVSEALKNNWNDFVEQSLSLQSPMPVLIQNSAAMECAELLWSCVIASNNAKWVKMLLDKMQWQLEQMVEQSGPLVSKPNVKIKLEPLISKALMNQKFESVECLLDRWAQYQQQRDPSSSMDGAYLKVDVIDKASGKKQDVWVRLGNKISASVQTTIRLEGPLEPISKLLGGRNDLSTNVLLSLATLAPQELAVRHFKTIDMEGVTGSYYNAPTLLEYAKDDEVPLHVHRWLARLIQVGKEALQVPNSTITMEKLLESVGAGMGSIAIRKWICSPDASVRTECKQIVGEEIVKRWLIRTSNKMISERWASIVASKDDQLLDWLAEGIQALKDNKNTSDLALMAKYIKDANDEKGGHLTLMQKMLAHECSVSQMQKWLTIVETIEPGLGRLCLEAKDQLISEYSLRKQTDFLGFCMLKNNLDAARWALGQYDDLDRTEARALGRYLREKKHQEHEKVVSSFESLLLERKLEKASKTKAFALKVKQHEKQQEKSGVSISAPAKMRRL